jgi:hypothetical protein
MCFRGNPISITRSVVSASATLLRFQISVQATGIPVPGLDSEHQPLIDLLTPAIVANIRDPNDSNLALLRRSVLQLGAVLPFLQVGSLLACLLVVFRPPVRMLTFYRQLESLVKQPEDAMRLLQSLSGTLFPILSFGLQSGREEPSLPVLLEGLSSSSTIASS